VGKRAEPVTFKVIRMDVTVFDAFILRACLRKLYQNEIDLN